MWAEMEGTAGLKAAEIARKTYGSFATAWQAKRDWEVWVSGNVGAQQSGEVEVEEVDHHPIGAEHNHADRDRDHAAAAHSLADQCVAQDLKDGGTNEDSDGSELPAWTGRQCPKR
jgi:hypothetical protein